MLSYTLLSPNHSLELLSRHHLEPRLPANLRQVYAHAQRERTLHPTSVEEFRVLLGHITG